MRARLEGVELGVAEWYADNYDRLNSLDLFIDLCDRIAENDKYFDGYELYHEILSIRDSLNDISQLTFNFGE